MAWSSVPLLGPLVDFSPLTKAEARRHREVVTAAIVKYCELADEAIPLLSKSHAELTVPIWGSIGDDEAEVIADCLINTGLHVGVAAQVVRGVVRSYQYLELGLILGPRFAQTVRYYVAHGLALSFGLRIGGGAHRAPPGNGGTHA